MSKKKAEEILELADVKINGTRSWDIQVKDKRLYQRVFAEGSIGLGEAYMDGWWDVKKLELLFYKLITAKLDEQLKPLSLISTYIKAKLTNRQSKKRAFIVGKKHYDKGNDLYEAMLDKSMTYTCGYWKNAKNLHQAQINKLDLVCKKIGLKKGMTVLDIGCGWGSFALYAAKKYGANVVGLTVSKEQAKLARIKCKGYPIEIRLQDYREIKQKFDRIISLGMFEHVGLKNYKEYMRVVNRCLKKDGLFLLHTIGSNIKNTSGEPWIDKYIFPNCYLPTISQISKSTEGLFVMEDWHNFGADYNPTLLAWFKNFDEAWPKLKHNYDERFYRMWKYYLLTCSSVAKTRRNQVWQIVYSKSGVKNGYQSIR